MQLLVRTVPGPINTACRACLAGIRMIGGEDPRLGSCLKHKGQSSGSCGDGPTGTVSACSWALRNQQRTLWFGQLQSIPNPGLACREEAGPGVRPVGALVVLILDLEASRRYSARRAPSAGP